MSNGEYYGAQRQSNLVLSTMVPTVMQSPWQFLPVPLHGTRG